MLLLYIITSTHSRLSHLARASILSALEIRSSLRINTSTQKAFDTRRSGIRKVHAVYMYPRKIHSTCLNTTWILPRSARSCSRDFILYVSTLHVVFHIDRAEGIRIMIIQITRTIYPISWDKSFPTYIQDVHILKHEHYPRNT